MNRDKRIEENLKNLLCILALPFLLYAFWHYTIPAISRALIPQPQYTYVPPTAWPADLKLSQVKQVPSPNGFGNDRLSGIIENTGNTPYSSVTVIANFYDKTNAKVSESHDFTNSMQPGEKWRFYIMCYNNVATSYKIVNITAYPESK